eukprot:TRINITY_DN5369_c0_g1_i1.p1 TRINITY_DN5369_c0_g1~~TRINITY_DN5369_c0_g1_i1.p1  ORF type:complete len:362 (+),score=50.34 TRINITY_DN5369_c0_g1_i1:115-1200(+)
MRKSRKIPISLRRVAKAHKRDLGITPPLSPKKASRKRNQKRIVRSRSPLKMRLRRTRAYHSRRAKLKTLSLEGVADYIKSGAKKIIVLSGAGVSVGAGLPDFRSPKTGLYYNLKKYNLPSPESLFDMAYFQENPIPFFQICKELYPYAPGDQTVPTITHYFFRLLEEKGVLLRNYTQNIDSLERKAGIAEDKLVFAHGTFESSTCLQCREVFDTHDTVIENVYKDKIPQCPECNGIIKPDITFFGEGLPARYFATLQEDFEKCDLLLVFGTSLSVAPFNTLIDYVGKDVPRVLFNKEEVGNKRDPIGWKTGGFRFDAVDNRRDVKYLGSCENAVKKLCSHLGWTEDLDNLQEMHKPLTKPL